MADTEHDIASIIAPLALPPQCHLMREVGCRLTGKGREARALPLAQRAVAGGAGSQAAVWIAPMVKDDRGAFAYRNGGIGCRANAGIVLGDRAALPGRKLLADVLHLGMASTPVRIGNQLPLEVPGIQTGEPRGTRSVTLAPQTMTRDARASRARVRAAECDKLTGLREGVARPRRDRCAAGEGSNGQGKAIEDDPHPCLGTALGIDWFPKRSRGRT